MRPKAKVVINYPIVEKTGGLKLKDTKNIGKNETCNAYLLCMQECETLVYEIRAHWIDKPSDIIRRTRLG